MDTVPSEALTIEKEPIKETNSNPADIENISKTKSSPVSQPLSKKLEDILAIIHTLSELLENVSVEQRTLVSQTQWTILEQFKVTTESNLNSANSWHKSLFARTYFVEKDLDECFTNVMKHTSILYAHIKDLNGKVQCRGDGVTTESSLKIDNTQSINSGVTTKDLSSDVMIPIPDNLPQMISKATATINEKSNEAVCCFKDVEIVRISFTNLMKAKIEFDSQFLNFNSILSKNGYSEDVHYLYEVSTHPNDNRGPFVSDNKKLRRKRVSSNVVEKIQKRRLRRSTRIASDDGTSEIQFIRSLKRQRS